MEESTTNMVRGDDLLCDTCGDVIPRGVSYRVGYTTPTVLASWFEDDPDLLPSFTQEPDGTVRIDVCVECAAESKRIQACNQPLVDSLQ